VDTHAAVEQSLPEAQSETCGLDCRVQALGRSAEEETRGAARTPSLSRERYQLVCRPEVGAGLDRLVPAADLRARRRDVQHGRRPEPGVDVVRVAPLADSAHGVLRSPADGQRCGAPRTLRQCCGFGPQRLAETADAASRAVSAARQTEA